MPRGINVLKETLGESREYVKALCIRLRTPKVRMFDRCIIKLSIERRKVKSMRILGLIYRCSTIIAAFL